MGCGLPAREGTLCTLPRPRMPRRAESQDGRGARGPKRREHGAGCRRPCLPRGPTLGRGRNPAHGAPGALASSGTPCHPRRCPARAQGVCPCTESLGLRAPSSRVETEDATPLRASGRALSGPHSPFQCRGGCRDNGLGEKASRGARCTLLREASSAPAEPPRAAQSYVTGSQS